jgi:hypothetical protein
LFEKSTSPVGEMAMRASGDAVTSVWAKWRKRALSALLSGKRSRSA